MYTFSCAVLAPSTQHTQKMSKHIITIKIHVYLYILYVCVWKLDILKIIHYKIWMFISQNPPSQIKIFQAVMLNQSQLSILCSTIHLTCIFPNLMFTVSFQELRHRWWRPHLQGWIWGNQEQLPLPQQVWRTGQEPVSICRFIHCCNVHAAYRLNQCTNWPILSHAELTSLCFLSQRREDQQGRDDRLLHESQLSA